MKSVVSVIVRRGSKNVELHRGEDTMNFLATGSVAYTLNTPDWREIGSRLRHQILAGRKIELKMSRSEGKLRIVATKDKTTYLDLILGDVLEFTDEFADAVEQANYRLSQLPTQPS